MVASAQHKGETPPIHIGDGVYASYDGFGIWLRVDREQEIGTLVGHYKSVVHEIYLEPLILQTLNSYADALKESTTRPAICSKCGKDLKDTVPADAGDVVCYDCNEAKT